MVKVTYASGLPEFVAKKIYKTGQTRGADDDQPFQNRVLRSSTVLIPYSLWSRNKTVRTHSFACGAIILVEPPTYAGWLAAGSIPPGVVIGTNALVYYETRQQWTKHPPHNWGFVAASSRTPIARKRLPLGGQFFARVPATTSAGQGTIKEGFVGRASGGKGAGIRIYEYASCETLKATRLQLAYLAWQTKSMVSLAQSKGVLNPVASKKAVETECKRLRLSTISKLERAGTMCNGMTICPLCRVPIDAGDLLAPVPQMKGREVLTQRITKVNLFHIEPLVPGRFNHKSYNLGWGHHHCNVVATDAGIARTLDWLSKVLKNNGYLVTVPK
ncbi:BstXI family restriction endonuclease [bacterium]|nr:BstXI family restriction endonuclease [bacterium]